MKRLILDNPALALAWLISGLMAVGLLGVWIWADAIATDFTVYWRTANLPVDLAYAERVEYPFPYAPPMLLWIKPLAYVPLWPSFAIWIVISCTAVALSCRSHLSPAAIALVLLSPPIVNGLATGQVSAVLAAILLWACGTEKRFAAGIAFGIVASIKPQLVMLAPLYFIVTRDRQAFIGAAGSFLAVLAVTLLAFGTAPWLEWIGSFDYFHKVLVDDDILGSAVTLAGAAEWWGLPPLPFALLGIGLGCWLVYSRRDGDPTTRCAVIVTASLMASPYALVYDLAPVVPFLVWSIFQGRVTSAVAISGAVHPLPLILTAVGLMKPRRAPGNVVPIRAGQTIGEAA